MQYILFIIFGLFVFGPSRLWDILVFGFWAIIIGSIFLIIIEISKNNDKKKAATAPSIIKGTRVSHFDASTSSAIEYEEHCAQILRSVGWQARLTKASGDQGADVIATKNGETLVVQCKKHRFPVGNKAVQEVHAAKYHYSATKAVVVSPTTYNLAVLAIVFRNKFIHLAPRLRFLVPQVIQEFLHRQAHRRPLAFQVSLKRFI